MMVLKKLVVFCAALLFSFSAISKNDICSVEEFFYSFGYEVSLSSTAMQNYPSLAGFQNTSYAYMSPDVIDKFDLAVIYASIATCVMKDQGEGYCIDIREGLNENPFLRTCNWWLENGIVKRPE